MASPSSSHFASASSDRSCKYDVFLSFRGEDTRKTFVDHLYYALVDRKIQTYKDDEILPRGESIGPSLFKAIEESQIVVIVFSKNYANSSWCLEELAHVMKCKDERGLIMMPVFYDVDPSEVRKQTGKFGEAFAKHDVENNTKVELWRKALVNASKIAGWEPKNIANGHESMAIKRIVDTILDRLLSFNPEVDEDLVGMKTRLQDLKSQLEVGSGGVRMVGIWGVGGGGKTTLATSLYMEISHHFEGHHIVENIREESHKYGLKKLQENILSVVFKRKVEVHSVAEGKSKLKRILCHRNVLILLDDVDDADQLEALAGSHSWFGSGSRIIVTTRDEHLLRAHNVDEIFRVKLLSNEEAIQLFNKRAYNEKKLVKDYETLSLSVVSYASGLPLALKVLGSFLYDKDQKEWMSTLARLQDIPETKILEQLKISYDGLRDVEKELFLDIACFFRGENTNDIDDAMEILEACGFHPDIGIKVLRQKALIDIVDGKFDMHDLVQEMGHYIVRGEQPNSPEKHSRVWKDDEIIDMCFRDTSMEYDKVKAIKYHVSNCYLGSRLIKIVSKMKELRWLSLSVSPMCHVEYVEGPAFHSNELRYICWQSYPASPFPHSFQPMNLVVLILKDNVQKELWSDYKSLPHLKVLKLVRMKKLLSTPDFVGLPCLQKLTIYDCQELEKIHPSLGNHRSLEYVNVSWCPKLKTFPMIVQMERLKTLEIDRCKAILEFPEIQSNMESLVNLSLGRNGIRVLPSSIGVYCTYLLSLHLVHCFNLKSIEFNFHSLKHLKELKCGDCSQLKKMPLVLFETTLTYLPRSLKKLDLGGCLLKDGEIPSGIGDLSNLQELNLSWNDFTRLDFNLLQLTRLKLLNLNGCDQLVEFPELPSSIGILQADFCDSLTTVGGLHENCKRLCQVSLTCGSIINDGGRLLQSMLEQNVIKNHSMLICLQGLEIAKGFTPPLYRGSGCRLKLPDNWCNEFCGLLMCAVVSSGCYLSSLSMKRVMSCRDYEDDVVWEEGDTDGEGVNYTWVWYVSFNSLRHTAWWDETYKTVSFSIDIPTLVLGPGSCVRQACSGFGVGLVASRSGSGLTETSTDEEESEFSHYTSDVKIEEDSQHALKFSF